MTAKILTSRAIEALKPQKTLSDTGDNRGLRITCGKTGIKTFFYRYTSPISGKLTQMMIGHFPQTSLAEARTRLQELKQLRQDNICPASFTREEKAKEEAQLAAKQFKAEMTNERIFELYLSERIEDRVGSSGKIIPGNRKPKGQKEVRRMLSRDASPIIGHMPAVETKRHHILELIQGILERGATVQAGNLLRELAAAYEHGLGLGYLPEDFVNPAILAKASLKQAKIKLTSNKGKRALSDRELTKFLKWLPVSAFPQAHKNILKMTLLTGCRTGEICNARWPDFDLKNRTFHVRESKTDTERYVQLPDQAVEFMLRLKALKKDYPFPALMTGKPLPQKQLTQTCWNLRKHGKMLDIDHWSPHDLRRTVRTGLARLQCPSEIAEAAIGHARKGIEGTYDLHSYEDQARIWLQKWADHLDALEQQK